MNRIVIAIILGIAHGAAAHAQAPRTQSPAAAMVYFIQPANGATVPSKFTVKFGLAGMGVAPAGVDAPDTGHHHLLVDAARLPALDAPLPADETHRHFGKGQTEARIELKPGRHTLRLLLADRNHIPHDPPVMSEEITVTVE